jgi:phosphoglycolate phosphatase
MSKYDLVIFDLDGTILDTSEGILAAAKYAIQQMGFELPSAEVLQSFIGPPIQDSFAKTFHVEGNELRQMSEAFRNQYKDHELLKAKPYEGIYGVFRALLDRRICIAIATYKREDYALRLLQAYSFHTYTSIIFGSDMEGVLKKQDIIMQCITSSNISDMHRVVMIGDTDNDQIGAAKLGLDFIGVTYGFGYKMNEVISGNNIIGIAETPRQILELID